MLERLREAKLKLKPEKCELLQPEVVFLGHKVNANGITPDIKMWKNYSLVNSEKCYGSMSISKNGVILQEIYKILFQDC